MFIGFDSISFLSSSGFLSLINDSISFSKLKMFFIEKIRNQWRKTVGVVVVLILLGFFASSGGFVIMSLFRKDENSIGSIFGEKIEKSRYNLVLEYLKKSHNKDCNKQDVFDEAWNFIVDEIVLNKTIEDLGISISNDELVDMVQGENIHSYIRDLPLFKDETTKLFSRNKVVAYLQNLPKSSREEQKFWCDLERVIVLDKKKVHLMNLLLRSKSSSIGDYVFYKNLCSQKRVVNYFYIPYNEILDKQYNPTEEEISNYYSKHRDKFATKKSILVKILEFKVLPSDLDKEDAKKDISDLYSGFYESSDPVEFAKSKTDSANDCVLISFNSTQIPLQLEKFKLQVGAVIGPVQIGNSYFLYRVLKILKKAGSIDYSLVQIEKKIIISDQTRKEVYEMASSVTKFSNFDNSSKLLLDKRVSLLEMDLMCQNVEMPCFYEFFSWAKKAKKGSVSKVFVFQNDFYFVGVITDKKNEQDYDLIGEKDRILKRLNVKKAKQIFKSKFSTIDLNNSLEKVSSLIPIKCNIKSNITLSFAQDGIGEFSQVCRLIGEIFAMHPQKKKIVYEDSGLFVVELIEIINSDDYDAKNFKNIFFDNYKVQATRALRVLGKERDNRF